MLDPSLGPYLFDTSAEGWFKRTESQRVHAWMTEYLSSFPIHVSAITVFERVRGYSLLWRISEPGRRMDIERARLEYLKHPGRVWPIGAEISVVAAEIAALVPHPPSPPKKTHRAAESRQDRLVRWRFDTLIAATALVGNLLLIHNNAWDFEALRGAIERAPQRFPGLESLKLMRCEAAVGR